MTMSYSRFALYETCPRAYYYHHVVKLPEIPKWYFSFGHTIHAVLEAAVRPLIETPGAQLMSKQDMLDVYSEDWERGGFESQEQEWSYFALGKEMLLKWRDKFVVDAPRVFQVEQNLWANHDGIRLHGILDRADLMQDGSLRVVDYKTTAKMSQADVLKSDQLTFYQALAQANFQVPVTALQLFDMRRTTVYETHARSIEQIEALMQRVTKVVAGIREKQFPPIKGRECWRCDWKPICPAWGGKFMQPGEERPLMEALAGAPPGGDG